MKLQTIEFFQHHNTFPQIGIALMDGKQPVWIVDGNGTKYEPNHLWYWELKQGPLCHIDTDYAA